MKQYLLGHDTMQLEALYWKICNPTASLYNNRTQMHAAIEFACIDIVGKKLGIRLVTCWAAHCAKQCLLLPTCSSAMPTGNGARRRNLRRCHGPACPGPG